MFNAKQNSKRYHRDRERNERAYNPCPGRSDSERMYLKRAMTTVAELYDFWLERTDHAELLLLPESYISSTVNDRSANLLKKWQDASKDDDGYLVDAHDHKLKATNIVTVGTWYRNEEQDLYPLFMPIMSPLPNQEWRAEPLNLAHWRAAIATLIEIHARWKWVHAVREYWKGDMTWSYGGTFGWRMETCKRLKEDDGDPCVGQAILTHALVRHLTRQQQYAQGTPCQQ